MAGANIKIGANSSEFQQQMKEVTRQLKLVSSECGVASEKAKLFGSTSERLVATQKELTAKLQAQNQMVKLYQDRIKGINSEIQAQKQKQTELSSTIDETTKRYKQSVDLTGKDSEQSKKLKEELEKLKEEYSRNENAIKSNNNKLVDATTKMNNTEKAILRNKKALEETEEKLKTAKLDDFKEKLNEVAEKTESVGNKMAIAGAGILGAGVAMGKMAFDTEQDLSTLGSRLGLTADETEKLKGVAQQLYNEGFGESLEECVSDVVMLQQNIRTTSNMSTEQKEKILEQISTLRTLFGAESEEVTKTLNNMIQNGVVKNVNEGLDVITAGFQQGLSASGDMLDVLYEYSPQFKKLGLDGSTALGMIKAGLNAGGFNADKMADALKELSIRAIDGSNTTIQGFQQIGLNADDMAKKFGQGGETAKKALIQTIQALKNMKDPVQQNIAGVNLFGI